MGRVVVGVDGSDGAAEALRWAAREAELRGWSITAVSGSGYVDPSRSVEAGLGHDYDPSDAQATLAGIVRSVLGEEPRIIVEQRVERDLGAPTLIEASRGADLLVVGARGLGGFRGLLLGSVSQQCLHHATSPVAIVRAVPPPHEGPERIVVGIDGSEEAATALGWALDEARLRQAEVEVVHSWHVPYLGGYPYAVAIDPGPFESAAAEVVDRMLKAADTNGLPGPVKRTIALGGASSAVLEAAASADLIVVGSHGVGGFVGMLIGSVSHAVAQHAPCPVVVIPPHAA